MIISKPNNTRPPHFWFCARPFAHQFNKLETVNFFLLRVNKSVYKFDNALRCVSCFCHIVLVLLILFPRKCITRKNSKPNQNATHCHDKDSPEQKNSCFYRQKVP